MEGEEIYQVRELLDSRLPGARSPILGRLGGLRSGRKVLGQRRWYSGPQLGGRFPPRPPGKNRPPDHAVDLGADHLLASGAARRGGGSVAENVPLAPSSVHQRDPLPSINLHPLSLITRPTCSSLSGLFNQPARVASLRSLVLPRWTFPSVSHCVVYPVIDWFRFTPSDWLPPAFWPQPWTLTTLPVSLPALTLCLLCSRMYAACPDLGTVRLFWFCLCPFTVRALPCVVIGAFPV